MKAVLISAGVAGAVLASALPAYAQSTGTDEFGAYTGREGHTQYESPQNAAFELRVGPYRPKVDDEFSGAKPFNDTFGSSKRVMIGIEVDWQALRIPMVGTVGPGLGWGYTHFGADALLADGSGNRSAQGTSLAIMPMYLVGVLRADVIARETPVPLVPYAKVGLGYALWWAGDGEGTSHDDNGVVGRGHSFGFQYAVGGMLLLDAFDRASAVEIDSNTGVNNTYFFLEWYNSFLGQSGDQMQVGTNTWMLGLALEI